MQVPFKTAWSKVIVALMRAIVFIVAAGILVACTKTEDYLRDMVTKHSDFIDPSSAIFRNITYGNDKFGVSDIYCGEINAKNRMGGYVGWKPFRVSVFKDGEVFVILLEPMEIPFRASADLQDKIEKLNTGKAESYESDCRNTQLARSWIPFWKAF